MSLASKISALAIRLAREIKTLVRPEHPGLARAWVTFGYVGGVIQIVASYNVLGVTRSASGRYRITFVSPFVDAHYCWVAQARSTSDSGSARMAIVRATSDKKTAAYVEVSCASTSTSYSDTTEMNVVVFR